MRKASAQKPGGKSAVELPPDGGRVGIGAARSETDMFCSISESLRRNQSCSCSYFPCSEYPEFIYL